MINQTNDFVAWALLVEELDEAREHLQKLISTMRARNEYGESDFAIDLGHVYAHLNRGWHARNQTSEISPEQRDVFSQFPKDLKPVG